MDVFIATPLLALAPAAAFAALHWLVRRRATLIAAGAWLAYWAYEESMKHRLLCSGECNIRVDLLLLYPLLLALSVVAVVSALRRRRERAVDWRELRRRH